MKKSLLASLVFVTSAAWAQSGETVLTCDVQASHIETITIVKDADLMGWNGAIITYTNKSSTTQSIDHTDAEKGIVLKVSDQISMILKKEVVDNYGIYFLTFNHNGASETRIVSCR